jgi:hypothetical protein
MYTRTRPNVSLLSHVYVRSVVAGDHFGHIVDRGAPLAATPGIDGQAADRCSLVVLVRRVCVNNFARSHNFTFRCTWITQRHVQVANEVERAQADGSTGAEAEARARIASWLDVECSVGRRLPDGSWKIQLSTFPWLEGTELLAPGDVTRAAVPRRCCASFPQFWPLVESFERH